MNFFGTVLLKLGVEAAAPASYRAVISGGGYGYFENVKGILSLGGEEVVLLLRKGKVRAEGKNLRLARYGGGDLLLLGDVRCIEAEGEER